MYFRHHVAVAAGSILLLVAGSAVAQEDPNRPVYPDYSEQPAYPEPSDRPRPPAQTARSPVSAPQAKLSSQGAKSSRIYFINLGLGSTIADGSGPFFGGAAVRISAGAEVHDRIRLEFTAGYTDYFLRGASAIAGASFTVGAAVRAELPLIGEWLRFTGFAGAHYTFAANFFEGYGVQDQSGRAQGPGVFFGGGLRFRLWRNPKSGTEFFLGAEFNSVWILQQSVSGAGPTVMNSLSVPVSVDWR